MCDRVKMAKNPRYPLVKELLYAKDKRLIPLRKKIKILSLSIHEKKPEVCIYPVFLYKKGRVFFVPNCPGSDFGQFYEIPKKDYAILIED